MKNLAVIPARFGSKRIPKKNIKPFLGKPIIAYSIEAALQSGLFEEVMVSTDHPEIKSIAEEFGASVPFLRSEENANDQASIRDVMKEVIAHYDQKGIKFDNVCCIFATAPFATSTKLQEGYDKLHSGDFISVVPVQAFSFPILRSLRINAQDQLEMNWPEHQQTRSQDLEEAYHDAGQFYWAKMEGYRKEMKFYSSKTGYIELKASEAQDIDTEEDWKIAALKFKISQHERSVKEK